MLHKLFTKPLSAAVSRAIPGTNAHSCSAVLTFCVELYVGQPMRRQETFSEFLCDCAWVSMLHKLFTKPLSATLSRGNLKNDADPTSAAKTFPA